jgi:hypothetical protein
VHTSPCSTFTCWTRSFTQKQASGIGITGFVSNASDGTVRLLFPSAYIVLIFLRSKAKPRAARMR